MPKKMAPVPSARQLMATWDERDARYAIRRHHGATAPLTPDEVDSVIANRREEANALPTRDRSVALAALSQWRAPAVSR